MEMDKSIWRLKGVGGGVNSFHLMSAPNESRLLNWLVKYLHHDEFLWGEQLRLKWAGKCFKSSNWFGEEQLPEKSF